MKKNKKRCLLLWIVFLAISCLYISPRETMVSSQSPSKLLKSHTILDDSSERIDYIDDNGNITMAESLGYATAIIKTNGCEKLESFYDELGDPVVLRSGYCAVLREFDKSGNTIRTVYLGTDGKPVTIHNGYASEIREYNQLGQLDSVRYYNVAGEPACSVNSGYGRTIQYDENGNQCKVTYINSSGEPMMTQRGYATISQTYYLTDGPEYGKVEREFYFDAMGEPVKLKLGQYGLHKEYDECGRAALLTYLDADGRPMIISKGYATVRRTFFSNDHVASERYYDPNGDPCCLPEEQYGFRWKDGKQVYLDENGNEQKSLRNLLYSQSWLVIVIAIVAVFLAVLSDKRVNYILLVLCILTILYLTLIARSSLTTTSGIKIFTTFIRVFFDAETRASVLKNVWLFIPLGAILYRISPRKSLLLIPLFISGVIEAIQLLTKIGYCDLIDLVSNGLGGMIGSQMAKVLTETINRIRRPKEQSVHPA